MDYEYIFEKLEEIRTAIHQDRKSTALFAVRLLQDIVLNKWKEQQLQKG